MAILADTNVLLRTAQPQHAHFAITLHALGALRVRGERPRITSQNIVEFWAVATRPLGANGLGLTTEQAASELGNLKSLFHLLPEVPIHTEWERIVRKYQVSGKSVHDARLVAAMIVHGIGEILTFNMQDFARYGEISVLDPANVS
jgi:predicted nucleic acid-binding protein